MLHEATINRYGYDTKLICNESNHSENWLQITITTKTTFYQDGDKKEYKLEDTELIRKEELFDYLKFVETQNTDNKFKKIRGIIIANTLFMRYTDPETLKKLCYILNNTLSDDEIQLYYESSGIEYNKKGFGIDEVLLDSIEYKLKTHIDKFQILKSPVDNKEEFIRIMAHLFLREWIFSLKECKNIESEYFEKYY